MNEMLTNESWHTYEWVTSWHTHMHKSRHTHMHESWHAHMHKPSHTHKTNAHMTHTPNRCSQMSHDTHMKEILTNERPSSSSSSLHPHPAHPPLLCSLPPPPSLAHVPSPLLSPLSFLSPCLPPSIFFSKVNPILHVLYKMIIRLTLRKVSYLCHHNACILQLTATHCNILQHSTGERSHTATHCNTLQHTATHCNTLQHTTGGRSHTAFAHCNWLHHTATHCNTLQEVVRTPTATTGSSRAQLSSVNKCCFI